MTGSYSTSWHTCGQGLQGGLMAATNLLYPIPREGCTLENSQPCLVCPLLSLHCTSYLTSHLTLSHLALHISAHISYFTSPQNLTSHLILKSTSYFILTSYFIPHLSTHSLNLASHFTPQLRLHLSPHVTTYTSPHLSLPHASPHTSPHCSPHLPPLTSPVHIQISFCYYARTYHALNTECV